MNRKSLTIEKKNLILLPHGKWVLRKMIDGHDINRILDNAGGTAAAPPKAVTAEAMQYLADYMAGLTAKLEATKKRKDRVALLSDVFEIYQKAAKTKKVKAENRKAAINALCYVVSSALDWPEANCAGSKIKAKARLEKVGKLSTSVLTESIIKRFSEIMFENGPKRYKHDGLKPHERGEPGELTEKEIKLPDLTDFLECDEGEKTEVEPYQMPSVDELAKLRRHLPEFKKTNPEAYKCFMCQCETGARLKEAGLMMYENFAENIEDGFHYQFTDTKSGHPRIVPFSRHLYDELIEMQTDEDYVVGVPENYTPRQGGDRGQAYRRWSLGKEISAWMRKCGWKRRQTNHENRKIFGTHMARETRNLRAVQYILGHSDYRTTEKHYVAQTEMPKYSSPTDTMPRSHAEPQKESRAA